MARKPNYRFDRMERDKAKAAKKAARQEAKRMKSDQRKTEIVELEAGPAVETESEAADGAPKDEEQDTTD